MNKNELGGYRFKNIHDHSPREACRPNCGAYADLQREKRAAALAAPETLAQQPDGSWVPAEPLPWLGWKAKTEQWFRHRGLTRLANLMAAWDERGLGR